MTHYTTQERANEMSNVMLKVKKLVADVESGNINNVKIWKLLDEEELTILAKNGIMNTDRTAKQIYNQIRTWFHNHRVAKYHIQVKGQHNWIAWNYASELEEAKKVFMYIVRHNPHLYYEDVRILDDFNGKIYRYKK